MLNGNLGHLKPIAHTDNRPEHFASSIDDHKTRGRWLRLKIGNPRGQLYQLLC
jgi:hypothetical protein